MEANIKQLPNVVKELIQRKRKKFLQYREKYKFNEDDLNLKTVLDSDFDFVQHMCDHTEDWKVLHHDPNITSYKSKENYTTIKDMKMQKHLTTVPYSIENVAKTLLVDRSLSEKSGMVVSSQFHHYQELNPNISSQKYSTVVHTCVMNYGAIFKKRSLENVITSRASFCGGKVQEILQIYKTCTYVSKTDDSKAPVKVVIIGGRLISRLDSNRTRVTDARLFNVGGAFMNSDLVVFGLASKKVMDDFSKMLKNSLREAELKGFPAPDPIKNNNWRALADYCRIHCGIDINKW